MTTLIFTPSSGNINTGETITAVLNTAAWPLEYLIIKANGKTLFNYTHTTGDDVTSPTLVPFEQEYEGTIGWDGTAEYTLTFQPITGWLTESVELVGQHKLLGFAAAPDATASLTVLISDAFNPNYREDAIDRLLGQFKGDSDNLQALLTSYITHVQALESEAHPLLWSKDVYTATGDRLDGLGQIVGEERQGRSDEIYRIRILARLAINKSNGTAEDLINILQLLADQASPDIWYEEYQPKTVYIRAKNYTPPDPPELIGGLLRLAKPAGTFLAYIYADDADDTNLFTFDSGPGLDQGKLAGDA